ncbi:MAG: hypothetical protein G01um101470_559 [Parcubacteria group bacterium Gr01-1014_70]|nr:MAG: hypothetical protein G01um101470_559 [Parcubacteria group bacterium Gr01-1014_70]
MKKKQTRISVRQDLTAVENKIEVVLETVNEIRDEMRTQTTIISQLPTREELATLLNMKQQLDRVREVIRERLKVEV